MIAWTPVLGDPLDLPPEGPGRRPVLALLLRFPGKAKLEGDRTTGTAGDGHRTPCMGTLGLWVSSGAQLVTPSHAPPQGPSRPVCCFMGFGHPAVLGARSGWCREPFWRHGVDRVSS